MLFGALLALIATVSPAPTAALAAGNTYYVSAAGDDSNTGTSASDAWRTVGRANARDLQPGDRVLFAGGQTFSGTVGVNAEDAGTAASPVTIGSYGDGRATIEAGAGKGVSVYNAGGVEVRDLRLGGAGYAAGNRGSGVELYTDLGGATKLEHVRVENVEASGFGDAGVLLGAYPADGTKSGFRDVGIVNVEAHDNADAGIESYGYYSGSPGGSATGWAHENVYVGYSEAYGNRGVPNKGNNSGSGIVLGDVNGAVVERSVAHHNGELNNHRGGLVGIWAWESNNVTIQHNESYANRTGTIDGGGFDLDGGVTNSVMQHNYSHDNAGAGYLLYQFSGARPFANNTVRYNVSENDGPTNLGGIFAGGGVTDTDVHNNTVFTSPRPNGQTFAAKAEDTSGLRFVNNIFVTTGGVPLAEASGGQAGLLFRGNDYWGSGDAFVIRQDGATYGSLGAWRNATGQERDGGDPTGLSVDPRLTAPGNGGTVGDADSLGALSAYRLLPGSPLVDAALDPARLGFDPGATDFYGTTIPQGAAHDVGTHELAGAPTNTVPTISNPRPLPGSTVRDRTPVIAATVRDTETNLSRADTALFVDGRRVDVYRYDGETDRLGHAAGRLSPGRHTVEVRATDPGGLTESRAWGFRVAR